MSPNEGATYAYEPAGQLTLVTNKTSNGTLISSFAYTLDQVGNRMVVAENNGDYLTLTYDAAYQLTQEQRSGAWAYSNTYTYDGTGNQATKLEAQGCITYTYDPAGQLALEQGPTWSTVVTRTYDPQGNLTLYQDRVNNLATYLWDGENRLSFSISGHDCHTFLYDADGLRRSWQHWAVGWGAPVITNTAWDNQNMLSGEANFVQSPGLYGENLIYDPGGWERFYHFDGMGSTTELTDSTGAVTDVHRYAAFGEPIYDVNSSAADRPHFRYVGKLGYYRHVDAGLGNLDYLRARWYNRDVRRFVSRDPIFNPGSLYPYALGNPGSWVDPSGMDCSAVTLPPPGWLSGWATSGFNPGFASDCVMVNASLTAAANDLNTYYGTALPGDPWGEACLKMETLVQAAANFGCYTPWTPPWGFWTWNRLQPCCCGSCRCSCPIHKGGSGGGSGGGTCPTCGGGLPRLYYGGPLLQAGFASPLQLASGTTGIMGPGGGSAVPPWAQQPPHPWLPPLPSGPPGHLSHSDWIRRPSWWPDWLPWIGALSPGSSLDMGLIKVTGVTRIHCCNSCHRRIAARFHKTCWGLVGIAEASLDVTWGSSGQGCPEWSPDEGCWEISAGAGFGFGGFECDALPNDPVTGFRRETPGGLNAGGGLGLKIARCHYTLQEEEDEGSC